MYVSFLKYKVRKLGGVGPQWPIGVLGVGITKGAWSIFVRFDILSKLFKLFWTLQKSALPLGGETE